MASLLDIADLKKTVTIRGNDIEVTGISAEGIALLLGAFPELKMLFGGKAAEISPEQMVKFAPRAVAAAIAAGSGTPGDEAAEAAAGRLAIGEQLELLAEIFDLTFPQGFGPFVEKLESFGLVSRAAELGTAPATKSPAPSKES